VAKPVSAAVCGEPAPVSVKTLLPLRFAPLGDPTFVKRTVTVHEAPGASAAPVQVLGPAAAPTLKK
jgi:hypothetical protein